jgi:hypothetical protein
MAKAIYNADSAFLPPSLSLPAVRPDLIGAAGSCALEFGLAAVPLVAVGVLPSLLTA